MNITEIHAHVSTASRDCDGPILRDYIMTPSEEEVAESVKADGVNDFSEIHFRERVLLSCISVYSTEDATLTVKSHGFTWHETTDEGYREASVMWCDSDCDTGQTAYRDLYAEAMNY